MKEKVSVRALSVSEARKRIPYIKEQLDELQQLHSLHQRHFTILLQSNGLEPEEISELRMIIDTYEEKMYDIIDKLLALDVVVRDIKIGLIDMVGIRHGKPVFLCYLKGEEDIQYYHEMDSGYKGRRPLDFD